MKNTVLKYGLIIGLVLGLFLVISISFYSKGSDLKIGEVIGFTVMTLAFCSMYFGIRSYRDVEKKGAISFGRAFAVGLLITLIASVIYSLFWTVYTEISGTNFEEMYIEMSVRDMQSDGLSESQIEDELKMMEQWSQYYRNPLLKFLITIVEPLPPGIAISLICALLLKKKAK